MRRTTRFERTRAWGQNTNDNRSETEDEFPSMTFTIQDGVESGQTVKHVHIHVVPRTAHDFDPKDAFYTEIQKGTFPDQGRVTLSDEEMARRASVYRKAFESIK